jgi:hypothetical protein
VCCSACCSCQHWMQLGFGSSCCGTKGTALAVLLYCISFPCIVCLLAFACLPRCPAGLQHLCSAALLCCCTASILAAGGSVLQHIVRCRSAV